MAHVGTYYFYKEGGSKWTEVNHECESILNNSLLKEVFADKTCYVETTGEIQNI